MTFHGGINDMPRDWVRIDTSFVFFVSFVMSPYAKCLPEYI